MNTAENREKTIVRTSFVTIAVNALLVALKAVIGLATGSIAILLDAVNNLSDALSSVLTIVGAKLSSRAPDKKHPYGYGRIEYLTSVVIACLVMFAGFTSARESIEKVLNPEPASYTTASLVILAAAVVVKFLSSRYVSRVGKQVQSQALIASGTEALFDSILSVATIGAAMVSMLWGLNPEGWLGAIISLIILKAGFEVLMESLRSIIGTRADTQLTQELKARIRKFPGVKGAYDLVLHNYGPNEQIGSVHVEVDDQMTAPQIHHLSRQITAAIREEYRILLTVGIYASNTTGWSAQLHRQVEEIVTANAEVLQMHGFYADPDSGRTTFDVVLNFRIDRQAVVERIQNQLQKALPDRSFEIVVDSDFSD